MDEGKIEEIIERKVEEALKRYKITPEHVITRDEFLAAIERIDKRFQEMLNLTSTRFEAMDKRFEAIQTTMQERFEAIDRRFEEMDRRFEAMQRTMQERFEAIDKRFEAIDRRFEEMDRRFEAMQRTMQERFEAIDRRFEAMNRRFEEMDRRFEAMQRTMQERFEAIDRRFEEVYRRFDYVDQRIWRVEAGVGALGARSGLRLERTILRIFREVLKARGVDVSAVEKLVLRDDEGIVFGKGFTTDIDIYVHDSERIAIEVKYSADQHDIFTFLNKVKLAEKTKNMKFTKLMLVTLNITDENYRYAESEGIKVITEE
ncbi:MAG: DUF3782 domain-containing protein [Candidatus Freyarchaeota archaeon]